MKERYIQTYGLMRRDVYCMMKGQLLEQGLGTVMSLSHYCTIWDTSSKNVVIPKVSISNPKQPSRKKKCAAPKRP